MDNFTAVQIGLVIIFILISIDIASTQRYTINELSKENDQLKKELEIYKKKVNELEVRNMKLLFENRKHSMRDFISRNNNNYDWVYTRKDIPP